MGAAGTPTVEEEDPVPGIKPIKKKPVGVVHIHMMKMATVRIL